MTTILVVDDNASIVSGLSEYLEASGYSVISASDGLTALSLALTARPDLALVDIMLPGMDGLELTKRFEAEGLPVILITARSDEVDRLVGLELGADDYITKPFSPREVVARAKAVLRRVDRQTQATQVIRVGELSIDSERRQVLVSERTVDLTRSEFDILATMAEHPGRVYSRMQLLEAATGEQFESYDRTVDAHIKNIRRKLGDDPRSPQFIHTVIGVGYKVEEQR